MEVGDTVHVYTSSDPSRNWTILQIGEKSSNNPYYEIINEKGEHAVVSKSNITTEVPESLWNTLEHLFNIPIPYIYEGGSPTEYYAMCEMWDSITTCYNKALVADQTYMMFDGLKIDFTADPSSPSS